MNADRYIDIFVLLVDVVVDVRILVQRMLFVGSTRMRSTRRT